MRSKSVISPETLKTRLIPLSKWDQYHPWPSVNALRHYFLKQQVNGFDCALKRVGRKILIDETAFFEWVDKQNPGKLSVTVN